MSKQEGINTLSTQRSETILKNIHSLTDYGSVVALWEKLEPGAPVCVFLFAGKVSPVLQSSCEQLCFRLQSRRALYDHSISALCWWK